MPPETLFERMSAAQQAHARSTDPEPSHEAARVVTPGLPDLQAMVERWAISRPDGFLDVELCAAHEDLGPSTLRTRRAELAARNIILDSGRRRKPEGASVAHTVWTHRSFVPDAPAIRAPIKPAGAEDKRLGLDMAIELDAGAKQMRAEGRVGFAAQLTEAARLMRILSA